MNKYRYGDERFSMFHKRLTVSILNEDGARYSNFQPISVVIKQSSRVVPCPGNTICHQLVQNLNLFDRKLDYIAANRCISHLPSHNFRILRFRNIDSPKLSIILKRLPSSKKVIITTLCRMTQQFRPVNFYIIIIITTQIHLCYK